MPKTLTKKQVQDLLKVSERTVDRMIQRGELVAYKLPSGIIRISQSSVETLLSNAKLEAQR